MDAAHKRPLAAFVVVSLASGMLLGQAARETAPSPTSTAVATAGGSDAPTPGGPASGGQVDATVGPTTGEPEAAEQKSIGRAPVLAPLRGPEVTVLISAPMYDPEAPVGEGETPTDEPTASTGEPVATSGPDDVPTDEPSPDPDSSTDPEEPTPSQPPKTKPTPTTPPRPTPPTPTGLPDPDDTGDKPDTRPTLAPTGSKPRP